MKGLPVCGLPICAWFLLCFLILSLRGLCGLPGHQESSDSFYGASPLSYMHSLYSSRDSAVHSAKRTPSRLGVLHKCISSSMQTLDAVHDCGRKINTVASPISSAAT
jgi:hypothetical protein